MKTGFKMFLVVALVLACGIVAGCNSGNVKPLTPAQVAAIACPPITVAITEFEAVDATLPNSSAAVKADAALHTLAPVVASACAAGSTVTADNITQLAQQVLPALGTVAGSLPLPANELAQIQAGLTAAEVAVGVAGVVEAQIQAAKAASEVPSTVLPPAAPVGVLNQPLSTPTATTR